MFPRIFHIGHFDMPTYGVLFSLGVILALWITARNFERDGIDPQKARNLGMLVVVSGLVGAKILLIIDNWSFYSANPREMLDWGTLQAGGVFSGGLLAALIAGVWYTRTRHMPALATSDAFAPGIALGHAVGRIGCFAAGCCWGKPTRAFWGVTFRNPLAHEWAGTPLGTRLVPTQLLESGIEFATFFLLMRLFWHKKFQGEVIGAYLFLYGLARYGIEYLRDDPGRGSVLGGAISGTQLIAIMLVISGVLLWLRRSPIVVPRGIDEERGHA